jgi:hypothetical protein
LSAFSSRYRLRLLERIFFALSACGCLSAFSPRYRLRLLERVFSALSPAAA